MILVDVQVLQLGEVYDFELDEEKTVREVLSDVLALICKKEKLHCDLPEEYFLFARNRECILWEEQSLKEQGVRSGERLILV